MAEDAGQLPAVQPESWAAAAAALKWSTPWQSLWTAAPPFDTWFAGGRLNAATNCVERHLALRADQPALLWEGEPGDRRVLTYAELDDEVACLTAALREMEVRPGDHIALHLGWIPETVVAMLACARVGAVHSILPTPLHTDGLIERLLDSPPKILFTQDGAWRRGSVLPLKARADEVLGALSDVQHTVVVRRTGMDVAWFEGDRWYHELIADARGRTGGAEAEAAALPASHPLLSVHLANRRGRPVSVVLSTANVLVTSATVHRHGVSGGGVFWLPGDASWLATQVHGVYGPLCNGDTSVMFEGTLDTPDPARTWEMIERYRVETLLLAPSLAQRLRRWSGELGARRPRAALSRCVTVGDKSDPELREWLAAEFRDGELSLADAWGQMELGGIVSIDNPVDPDLLPSARLGIVDRFGQPVPSGEVGEVVVGHPWPGTTTNLLGEGAADVVADHWGRYADVYATGDMARLEAGRLDFLGRRDSVVSISGHLVSLAEIEATLLDHPYVQFADVVDIRNTERGVALLAAVVLNIAVPTGVQVEAVAKDILDSVRDTLGGLARPRSILVLDRLGDELAGPDRRAALASLAGSLDQDDEVSEVSWLEVLTAAGAPTE